MSLEIVRSVMQYLIVYECFARTYYNSIALICLFIFILSRHLRILIVTLFEAKCSRGCGGDYDISLL